MKQALNKILKNDKLIVVGNQIVVSGTSFASNIMIASICGISNFGLFSAWQMAAMLMLAFQIAIVGQPMQVFMGNKKGEDNLRYIKTVFSIQALFLILILTLVGSFAVFNNQFPLTLIAAFTVYSVFYLSQEHFRRFLIAKGNLKLSFMSDIISCFGQLALLCWAWASHSRLSIASVFFINGFTTLPAILTVIIIERKNISFSRYTLIYIKEHWRSARWLIPTALIQWGASNYLLAASAVISGTATLGVLRLAQTIMGVFNVAIQGLENYLLPYMSKLMSSGKNEAKKFMLLMSKKITLISAPILIIMGLFSASIIGLINPEFSAHAALFRWCCILYIIILASFPLKMYIRVLGDSRYYFIGYLISISVSVLTASWLINTYQAVGVVIGWLLSQLVINIFWSIIISKKQFRWILK